MIECFAMPEPNSGCLIWLGGIDAEGYGRYKGRHAHIVSFEETHGPVSQGKVLHHKCEVPLCIEEKHLIPVTRAEHRRIHSRIKGNLCKNGHDLTIFGVQHYRFSTKRCDIRCGKCEREAAMVRYHKRRNLMT